MTADLVAAIVGFLDGVPSATARDIARGLNINRTAVNQILYRYPGSFDAVGDRPPVWSLKRPDDSEKASRSSAHTAYALPLYDWQLDALMAWEGNGRVGIVEAVTGSGKTRLGLCAVAQAVAEGQHAAVVVPTIELMDQWYLQLTALLSIPIGRLGDGHFDDLENFRIVIATAASARSRWLGLSEGQPGLIVADEVHRFAPPPKKTGSGSKTGSRNASAYPRRTNVKTGATKRSFCPTSTTWSSRLATTALPKTKSLRMSVSRCSASTCSPMNRSNTNG